MTRILAFSSILACLALLAACNDQASSSLEPSARADRLRELPSVKKTRLQWNGGEWDQRAWQ